MLLVATAPCLALPAFADDHPCNISYALNDGGSLGVAYRSGTQAGSGACAIQSCSGSGAGCNIVMSVRADCVAMSESRNAAGNWFWVGNTWAENAYDGSGELRRVEDMVMGWCNASEAPAGPCVIRHSDCMNYIRNLN